MSHINEIKKLLDSVAADGDGAIWNDSEWTKQIKNRVCTLGKRYRYWVYASSCDGTDGGEWLYDITWLNYSGKKLIDVELVLESEWKKNGIDDDFQKLLLARAELRVMVFQSRNKKEASKKLENLIDQIKKFSRSESKDVYLLSCWLSDIRKFYHKEFVLGQSQNLVN